MLELSRFRDAETTIAAPKASSLVPAASSGTDMERVYSEVFDAIMDRRLLPGAKLTEAALCALFDCSRSTVRATLTELAHRKVVVIVPNRGAFVWKPSAKETEDIFDMRRAIECLVLERLLELPDFKDRIQSVHDMVVQERLAFEIGDRISWIRLSNAFHVELARLVGNQVLTELMHSLCSRTSLIIAYYDIPGDHTCSYIEHKEILDLLELRDRDGVMQAMYHHLHDCEQRMNESKAGQLDLWRMFGIRR